MSENSHDEERIAHLLKLMESFKADTARMIGASPFQAILNHPYAPNSSVPIPNGLRNDEKLVKMWPQVEKQVLEWRKILYLMSYLFRASVDEMRPFEERVSSKVERLRAYEQMYREPFVQRLRVLVECIVQRSMQSNETLKAFEDHARAYAEEYKDVDSMEWYAKQAGKNLPSAMVMLEKLQTLSSSHATMPPVPYDGLVMMRQLQQLLLQLQQLLQQLQLQLQQQLLQPPQQLQQLLRLPQQLQQELLQQQPELQQQLLEPQQQQLEPQQHDGQIACCDPSGIMKIRMASSYLE